ncbi:MAG: hypothetical protein H6686_04490 [Fibrobacteria bacterium]|nr:hypothetical protein [Fibrobacteria bacterium]
MTRSTASTAFVLASVVALLPGCDSGDRVSGNNGTSTDNVLTAMVISIDSAAFGQERPDTGAYPLLLNLDAARINFSQALPGGADLRVQLDDTSSVPFQIREWNEPEHRASLWVRLPRPILWKGRKLLVHHGERIPFRLSDSTATWNGVSPQLRARINSILLADFEQDSLFAPLPCQCNNWYIGVEGGAKWDLPGPGQPIESAVEIDSLGPRSRVLHLRWNLPLPSNWALAGTHLGTRPQRMNLLDSITFRARGKTTLRITLEDSRDTLDKSKAWVAIKLDTAWRHYRVSPSDFDAPDTWSLGWASVAPRVTTFSLFMQYGTELWIDDIRFWGIGATELR